MKKFLATMTTFGLMLLAAGCQKTTTNSSNTTNNKTTNNKTTTIKGSTTNGNVGPEVFHMPEFKSSYKLHNSDTLPVINITSNSGNNDFITKPVSSTVKAQTYGDRNGWAKSYHEAPDPYYEQCTITVTDENGTNTLENVSGQVKVRGNWTSTYDKKGLRIKFNEKQAMLDLNNGAKKKSWVLLAEYKDWSMLRNSAAFYTSHLLSSYYTTDFRYVEIYSNGEYMGLYLLAEQQEVNKDRININKPADGYTGTDIGYFLEYDTYAQYEKGATDYNFSSSYYKGNLIDGNGVIVGNFNPYYTIKSDIYSQDQVDFINNYMTLLYKICYKAVNDNKYYEFNEDYTEIVESNTLTNAFDCVSKYINIESLIDMYIEQELFCDPDLYLTSFLMDVDFSEEGSKKLTFEASWDYDSAMGNKRHCANGEGLFAGAGVRNVNYDNGSSVANPWMLIFVNTDWFNRLVKEKWNMVYDQGIFTEVLDMISTYTTKYATYYEKNDTKWTSNRTLSGILEELNDNSKNAKTQSEASAWLHTWYTSRINYLNSIWHY